MTYCIDTDALIHSWRDHYRPSVFPSFWEQLSVLANDGTIISSRSVYDEIHEFDDALIEWRNEHVDMFLEDDEQVQEFVRGVYANWPNDEVDWNRKLLGADLFVIGHAQVNGFSVVSHENSSNNMQAPKIPDACDYFDVPCIKVMDMIEELGWTF